MREMGAYLEKGDKHPLHSMKLFPVRVIFLYSKYPSLTSWEYHISCFPTVMRVVLSRYLVKCSLEKFAFM